MRKAAFNKHLESLELEDLKTELTYLFDHLPEVKAYYKMELGSDEVRAKMYIELKKKIAKCFATRSKRRPRRPRIRKVNSILSEAKKAAIFDHEMGDVYLYTAEIAIDFMKDYDFYSEVLTNNITKNYEKALKCIQSSLTKDLFEERFIALYERLHYDPTLKRSLKIIEQSIFDKG